MESNINIVYLSMDLPSIVLIALALSMDAFAVSIASGMVQKN